MRTQWLAGFHSQSKSCLCVSSIQYVSENLPSAVPLDILLPAPLHLESSFPLRHLIASNICVNLQSFPEVSYSDSLRQHSQLKFELDRVHHAV